MKSSIAAFVLMFLAPIASGSTIVMLGGDSLPNTAGQTLTFMITGTDFYTFADVFITINGGVGPAPAVELVFNDPDASISTANLAGSVWAGGNAGIGSTPNGTTATSSGLTTRASFGTAGGASVNTQGIFLVLTYTTVGSPNGPYELSFDGTVLYNGLDEGFEPILVPLNAGPFVFGVLTPSAQLNATPTPGTSISLGEAIPAGASVDLQDAVTLANVGHFSTEINVESAVITGPDAALFEIIDGFTPSILVGQGSEVGYGVRFLGTGLPGDYHATLTFNTMFEDWLEDVAVYPLFARVVPEPSAYFIAATGLVGLLFARRRMR